jgi:hypothetical protein
VGRIEAIVGRAAYPEVGPDGSAEGGR